jgi:hypothetical protein
VAEINYTTMFGDIVFTWLVGLIPPVIIRFAILKRPIARLPSILICILFFIINIVFFMAIGSQSKGHTALFLVAFVSYWILRCKYEIWNKVADNPTQTSGELNEDIPDTKEWYYRDNQYNTHGPFSLKEMKDAYSAGIINEFSPVKGEKMSGYLSLRNMDIMKYLTK